MLSVYFLFTFTFTSVSTALLLRSNCLYPGQKLGAGESLFSKDRQIQLVYQGDGNLVISKVSNGFILWSCGGNLKYAQKDSGNCRLCQKDQKGNCISGGDTLFLNPQNGHLETYLTNGGLNWQTLTPTNGLVPHHLVIKNNGALVVYSTSTTIMWSSLNDLGDSVNSTDLDNDCINRAPTENAITLGSFFAYCQTFFIVLLLIIICFLNGSHERHLNQNGIKPLCKLLLGDFFSVNANKGLAIALLMDSRLKHRITMNTMTMLFNWESKKLEKMFRTNYFSEKDLKNVVAYKRLLGTDPTDHQSIVFKVKEVVNGELVRGRFSYFKSEIVSATWHTASHSTSQIDGLNELRAHAATENSKHLRDAIALRCGMETLDDNIQFIYTVFTGPHTEDAINPAACQDGDQFENSFIDIKPICYVDIVLAALLDNEIYKPYSRGANNCHHYCDRVLKRLELYSWFSFCSFNSWPCPDGICSKSRHGYSAVP